MDERTACWVQNGDTDGVMTTQDTCRFESPEYGVYEVTGTLLSMDVDREDRIEGFRQAKDRCLPNDIPVIHAENVPGAV